MAETLFLQFNDTSWSLLEFSGSSGFITNNSDNDIYYLGLNPNRLQP